MIRTATHCRRNGREARGLSLVELLLVMVLILVISAITLRTLTPALANRKTREAARMVSVFVSATRQRAIETGRPAGVWIERMTGLPEASVSLAYAQVPEPYSGDFSDSGLEAFCLPPWTVANRQTSQYFINVVVPRAGTMSSLAARQLDTWCTADPNMQNLVRPGDQLRLNYQGIRYTLNTIKSLDPLYAQSPFYGSPINMPPTGPCWIIGIGANKSSLANAAYTGIKDTYTKEYIIKWFGVPPGAPYAISTYGSSPVMPLGKSVPYQIIRQPQKSASGGIQLPEGTIIDLNYSGVGSIPFQPRYIANDYNATTGIPNNAYRGTALDAYGQPLNSGTPTTDIDLQPIIIMFDPAGSVEKVYHRVFYAGNQSWNWTSEMPFSTIFLLIGKREKVPITPVIPAGGDQWSNLVNFNHHDPTNLWVGIIPRSGLLLTAEATPVGFPAGGNYAVAADANGQTNTSRGTLNTLSPMGGR